MHKIGAKCRACQAIIATTCTFASVWLAVWRGGLLYLMTTSDGQMASRGLCARNFEFRMPGSDMRSQVKSSAGQSRLAVRMMKFMSLRRIDPNERQ